jgi:hypothetical protein
VVSADVEGAAGLAVDDPPRASLPAGARNYTEAALASGTPVPLDLKLIDCEEARIPRAALHKLQQVNAGETRQQRPIVVPISDRGITTRRQLVLRNRTGTVTTRRVCAVALAIMARSTKSVPCSSPSALSQKVSRCAPALAHAAPLTRMEAEAHELVADLKENNPAPSIQAGPPSDVRVATHRRASRSKPGYRFSLCRCASICQHPIQNRR